MFSVVKNSLSQEFLSLIGIAMFIVCSCVKERHDGTNIFYPQPAPDSIALDFLPGIVSKESRDFGSTFSPDGKSFYFSRSENKLLRIYVTRYDGKNWTQPEPVSFMDADHSYADPAFSPDGELYFISNLPKTQSDSLMDFDIWFSTLQGDEWSVPINLEIVNSDSSEYYVSFSKNANLYFSSAREGGMGQEDIYFSKHIDGIYTTPENLGSSINTDRSEYDPCVSSGEDFIVFTSSGREDSFGAGDLYISKFDERTKEWLPGRNLGKEFNTIARDYCPYLTPDLKYFFYSSNDDVKWTSAQSLMKAIGAF